MMHHPNMHHQPMSGHPPQHLGGHQGMPTHHQIPPHQMHRENRHVPVHRVVGGSTVMSRSVRPLHAAPPLHHPHHHPPPPPHTQMKPVRRFSPQYPQYPPPHTAPPIPRTITNGLCRTATPPFSAASNIDTEFRQTVPQVPCVPAVSAGVESSAPASAPSDASAPPAAPATVPAKEKTPMCLVNELARYNKIKHQYRLTSETGPAHKKVFTVTLRLGDTEEYTAEGSSIKRAQHAAAAAALRDTTLPAPPARMPPPHPHPPRQHGTVMPTVELNALAMKLCQPAVYSAIPAPPRLYHPHLYANITYRMKVSVGGRSWVGSGPSPQSARHDAAARALAALRPAADDPAAPSSPGDTAELAGGDASSEVKSPVSLVHELALKRNMPVVFAVKSERGPPHMRVFVTTCTVGDLSTEGEGNGKKVSKRRAAENMVQEMKNRWGALARSRPPSINRRKAATVKKKPRNLIKENGSESAGGPRDNPISAVAQWCHVSRAPSPQYAVEEERGAARRREFTVRCTARHVSATGHGPNKKTAKRRAAHNVLVQIEGGTEGETSSNGQTAAADLHNGAADSNTDAQRKESESNGTNSNEGRQPVPGVLMMDFHSRSKQTNGNTNGLQEETSASAGQSPGAKDQLLYLSQLLGFTVQFSDFPKRNHGSYLSLVSLSTSPPVLCHGGGSSTASSHEACARAALTALADMGLSHTQQTPPANGKPSTIPE